MRTSTSCTRRLILAGLFHVALTTGTAGAQGTAAQPLDADVSLETILGMEAQSVFGASKFLQKTTEAPAAVTIVTAEEIERYGWRTLADVLRSVRGFYVTDDRMWAYVGVRGFQRPGDYNTRLLLLVDGERVNDNVFDQALVQEDFVVDLDEVERVEVVRGPASSLYGSNAFFGVINVVTRPPAARPTAVAGGLGTLGQRTGRAGAARRFASGLAVAGSLAGVSLDGMDAVYFPEFDAPDSNDGIAEALDYTRHANATGTATWGRFAVRGVVNSRTRGYPGASFGTVFNDGRASVRDDNAFVAGAWDGSVAGWSTNLRAGWHRYHYEGHYPYAREAGGVDDNVDLADGTWLTGEARASRVLATAHRVTAGVEMRGDLRMRMRNYSDPAELLVDLQRRSRTIGLYVQDEWRLHPKVLINAGLRQDHYGSLGDPLKPRVGIIVQPTARTTTKLLYGSAFRAANVYEREYALPGVNVASPDLRPEEIRTIEAVVEHYAGRRVRVSGAAFDSTVERLIDLAIDPDAGLPAYRNLAAARTTGAELEVEAKWPVGVQARASYTYAHVRDDGGGRLSNAPAHLVQALFSAPLGAGTFLGIDGRALSARLDREGEAVDGHVVADVTVSGPLPGGRLRYLCSIDNVGDARYADPVSSDFVQRAIVQNGRTARVRLTWSF